MQALAPLQPSKADYSGASVNTPCGWHADVPEAQYRFVHAFELQADENVGRSPQEVATGFDWLAVLLAGWLSAGLTLDLWAHHHRATTQESILTPWHAVLYLGFIASSVWLIAAWRRRELPNGYGLSLVGSAIFATGGTFDLLWHTLLGVELEIEAAVSPPHLLLVAGGALILSGPLRAAWLRSGTRPQLFTFMPTVLSLAFTLALLWSLTEYVNAFTNPWASIPQRLKAEIGFGPIPDSVLHALGLAGVIVQSLLVVGATLVLVMRWRLPPGSLTLAFTTATVLLSFSHDRYEFIVTAFIAGLFADLLVDNMRPELERPGWLRSYALLVPAILFTVYFLTIEGVGGRVWWSMSLTVGAIALASAVGLGVAELVITTARWSRAAGLRASTKG